MRLHRFYVGNPISEKSFDITDKDLIHQWKSVFRYNVGSQVILFDGSGSDYLCMISSLRNSGATMSLISETKNNINRKLNLWVCLALIKKDNFELAVQKATEIGVNHIVPILCERSEKKKINLDRLNKIATEASEQSGRGDIPKIHDVYELKKLLNQNLLPNSAVYLDVNGRNIHDFMSANEQSDLAVFIGPEGGWSNTEKEELSRMNIPSISLGHQVLRAETAVISASTLLLL